MAGIEGVTLLADFEAGPIEPARKAFAPGVIQSLGCSARRPRFDQQP